MTGSTVARLTGLGEGCRADPPVLQPDDIVPDSALAAGDTDRFDHEAIAGRIAELACGAQPPINIALYGPWGSGKSSIYAPMRARIKECQPSAEVVRYDAWQYGGQSLKRNFIDSIADELNKNSKRRYKPRSPDEDLTQSTERYSLRLWRWLWTNKGSLGLAFALAVLVAALWLFGTALVSMLTSSGVAWWEAVNDKVSGAGTVLGLLLAAALFGPKALESATVKITQPAPQSDDEFVKHFDALVEQVPEKGGQRRLVVFIDELDRCAPEDVVSTLINLKTFLDRPGCVFVVAADREVLESALRAAVPQAKPVREEEPYYSTPGAFLDKIFQHQIALPPLRTTALTRFARSLVVDKHGLWRDLRDRGPGTRTFDDVIYTLIPAHVRSPRRVKVLLNNYATLCRIAQARGFDWLDRATEIAMLTALRTEFPAFAADLLQKPRLIEQLLGHDAIESAADDRILAKYRAGGARADGGPTGELLADEGSADQVDRAERLLTQQLDAYLKKAAAGNTPRPRLDLLYLQRAGQGEGLEDPYLAEVIDYASDTAPKTVIDAFADRHPDEIRTAARLLAERSNAEFGRGQINLVASACGLVERLEHDDVRPIAAAVAPSALVIAQNGDLHPDSYLGALTAAALADNQDLVDRILDELLDDDAEVSVRVLGKCARSLPLLTGKRPALLAQCLVKKYEEHPDLVHTALQDLPATAALRLWAEAEDSIRDVLTSFTEAAEASEPATTTPAKTTAAGTQPAPASSPTESAAERYTDLLNAVDSRVDPSPALMSQALLMGQSSAIANVVDIARERSEDLLARVGDPAIVNEHALVGLAANRPQDWTYWADLIDTTSHVTDDRAAAALGTVVRGLSSAPLTSAKAVPAIAERVLQALPEDDDHRRTNLLFGDNENLIGYVLEHIGWNQAEAATRRSLTYDTVERIRRLLGPAIDRVLADDVLTGISDHMDSDDSFASVRRSIAQLPEGAAALLDNSLDAYEEQTTDPTYLLRARIAARSRVGGMAIPAQHVQALELDRTSAKTLVSEWLTLSPPVAEALELVPAHASPAEATLRAYSDRMSPSDRTALWIGLENSGAGTPLLAAVAQAGGLSVETVHHIRQRVEKERQQNGRAALVKRLLTIPITTNSLQGAACDVALYLLSTQNQGDAASAATIVISAGGAAHGYTAKLRTALQAAEDRNGKIFTKTQKEALANHNLLRRSKKNVIERLLDW
jgi:hypothetical protein